MNYSEIYNQQKQFFLKNQTKSLAFRIEILKKLKAVIQQNEVKLCEAIELDFKKSAFDTFMTELSMIYKEIDHHLKNVKKWSEAKSVSVELMHFPSSATIYREPLGVCLIIGAWNYPYQLSLLPAISALAAGNTVIIKPSELPARTSQVMAEIIKSHFIPELMYVAEGGVEVTQELLQLPFDKIFFTGSTQVGKIVAKAAAEHLTPVTLELGGKSPCFVYADADLDLSAQRIVWAKFLNAGQTCVAPDYLCVQESVYDLFLDKLKFQIIKQFGEAPEKAENFCQIITTKHVERLQKLITAENVFWGGHINRNDRYISPTLLKNITFEHPAMQEEIFGPILPVLKMSDENTLISEIKTRPKPLALYLFTKNQERIDKFLNEISFGGGCINDCIMHLAAHNLPFGGVGESGIGSYHGEAGFRCFSHEKGILHKNFLFEPAIKYSPYSKWKKKILKWLT